MIGRLTGDGAFPGLCALNPGAPDTPFEARVAVGWRPASAHRRKGYARGVGAASLGWSRASLATDAVMAIAARINRRSWGLTERLGMRQVADADFDHPPVPEGPDLRPDIVHPASRAA